jgi:hypothetical protein
MKGHMKYYSIILVFGDGTVYNGRAPGQSEEEAKDRLYSFVRHLRVSQGKKVHDVLDSRISENPNCTYDKPIIIGTRKADPDYIRETALDSGESARINRDRQVKRFQNGITERFDAKYNPLHWTERELALSESRLSALQTMVKAEARRIRTIKVREKMLLRRKRIQERM